MAAMREMAAEYRIAAAKLKMRIEEMEAAGAPNLKVTAFKRALYDIREVQRMLDGYYDVPRSETIAAVGWKARKSRDDC